MTDLSIRIHMFVKGTIASVIDGLKNEERGQDLIEYAMLAGLIALALLGAGFFFRDSVTSLASGIGRCIDFDNGTTCAPGF